MDEAASGSGAGSNDDSARSERSIMPPPKPRSRKKSSVSSSTSSSALAAATEAVSLDSHIENLRQELRAPSIADAYGSLIASYMRQLTMPQAIRLQNALNVVVAEHMEAAVLENSQNVIIFNVDDADGIVGQ